MSVCDHYQLILQDFFYRICFNNRSSIYQNYSHSPRGGGCLLEAIAFGNFVFTHLTSADVYNVRSNCLDSGGTTVEYKW